MSGNAPTRRQLPPGLLAAYLVAAARHVLGDGGLPESLDRALDEAQHQLTAERTTMLGEAPATVQGRAALATPSRQTLQFAALTVEAIPRSEATEHGRATGTPVTAHVHETRLRDLDDIIRALEACRSGDRNAAQRLLTIYSRVVDRLAGRAGSLDFDT